MREVGEALDHKRVRRFKRQVNIDFTSQRFSPFGLCIYFTKWRETESVGQGGRVHTSLLDKDDVVTCAPGWQQDPQARCLSVKPIGKVEIQA